MTHTRADTLPTPQQVADFWDTVFHGEAPHGVPTLNATRSNPRVVGGAMVWDVSFDSYRDPDTDLPLRIGGFYAVPTGVAAPGPAGTYPGFVSTHSVGAASPAEGLDTAVYYAEKGYASMAFFLRGYPPSTLADPALNATTSNTALCENMVDDPNEPFDTPWAGYPVDLFQAAEFMAAQPEVWIAEGLRLHGHSLGGHAAAIGGIFSEHYRVIAASAPPGCGDDVRAWMNSSNPISSCVRNLPGDLSVNLERAIRMFGFVGAYQILNSPEMVAIDPTWKLDNTEIWFYGGENDSAVPAEDVAAAYELTDASNNKAMHWSPIGGHGGPEQFGRSQAWFDGHYPGVPASPPTANLVISSINGLTVTFSGQGSIDNDIMVAWDFDFGDGSSQNWGNQITHNYPAPGSYTASLTVTDGEGRRDTNTVEVTVTGEAALALVVSAPDPMYINEGESGSFTVNLSEPPGRTVFVSIARDSGDSDLSITSSDSLGFNDLNWNVAHDVIITAAQDADGTSGTAIFSVTASDVPTVFVNVEETDDDASFTFRVGTATGVPGSVVPISISLLNPDAARVKQFSWTLEFDGSVLGTPVLERGSEVPDPALWVFGGMEPVAGVQTVAAYQIVQPEGLVMNGIVAIDRFTIAEDVAPGIYEVTLTAADINDGAAVERIAGEMTVVAPSLMRLVNPRITEQGFEMTLLSDPGIEYHIQGSSDFEVWTDALVLVPETNSLVVTIPPGESTSRYFRVLKP